MPALSEDSPTAPLLRSRLSEFGTPSPAEFKIFCNLAGTLQRVPRHRAIRREGEKPQSVWMLDEGWVLSSITLADGGRQILKIHLPGDILGAPSIGLEAAAETLTALTEVQVRPVSLHALGSLFTRLPHLAALMFLSAQQERLILMDRLCSVGRTLAECRLAALLVHLHDRLRVIDPDIGTRFSHPLTQEQVGDIIGLTSVHVNRVFRTLERKGLILRDGHSIDLLDLPALRSLSGVPLRKPSQDLSWLPAPLA